MKKYYNDNIIEVGVDECARGVLLGRIYACAVIYPKTGVPEELEKQITDSKKLSSKKRLNIYNEIKSYVKYCVSYMDENEVDEKGIQYCNYKAFHDSINGLNIKPDHILVDGRCFKDYYFQKDKIPHTCIIKGDSKFLSIATASIIAKVEHDKYIVDLVNKNPDLNRYDLLNNMGYGTKYHINGIIKYGYTSFHRKSYKIKKLIL